LRCKLGQVTKVFSHRLLRIIHSGLLKEMLKFLSNVIWLIKIYDRDLVLAYQYNLLRQVLNLVHHFQQSFHKFKLIDSCNFHVHFNLKMIAIRVKHWLSNILQSFHQTIQHHFYLKMIKFPLRQYVMFMCMCCFQLTF